MGNKGGEDGLQVAPPKVANGKAKRHEKIDARVGYHRTAWDRSVAER